MVIEKAKAHERNVLEYKDHQASHGGANSVPSYNNPLLSAHALSKRRPSGRGNNGQRCGKCGKSHERGTVLPMGKCKGINHFQAVCRSKVCSQDGTEPSPKQEVTATEMWFHGKLQWPSQRRWQKEEDTKEPPKQNAYAVTMKNSVPSEVTTTSVARERITVMYQRWSFQDRKRKVRTTGFLALQFIVKWLKAPMLRVSPRRGLYTDTDPDARSEIITDVTIRMPGKAGTMMMEVKVDPGAQPSCIPLHKFKTLFPHLCRDGLPREGLLDTP